MKDIPIEELRQRIIDSYQTIMAPAVVRWNDRDYSISVTCGGEVLFYYHKKSETLDIGSINIYLNNMVSTYFIRLKEESQ